MAGHQLRCLHFFGFGLFDQVHFLLDEKTERGEKELVAFFFFTIISSSVSSSTMHSQVVQGFVHHGGGRGS